jgi:hypothetical protein
MPSQTVLPESVGRLKGLEIEVAAVDAVSATVDLAVACLFEREADQTLLSGGMRHLDDVLGQAATRLRAEGVFAARTGDALLIQSPSAPIMAGKVLIIGLGDPASFTAGRLTDAAQRAFETANWLGARSLAFAPSLLDAGVHAAGDGELSRAMIEGVAAGLNAAARRAELGLAPPSALAVWTFGASPAHVTGAATAFRNAVAAAFPPNCP